MKFSDEIKANPTSSNLHISLLNLYEEWGNEDNNKLKEAYNHGTQVEARRPFYNTLEWYQSLLSVIEVSFAISKLHIVKICCILMLELNNMT